MKQIFTLLILGIGFVVPVLAQKEILQSDTGKRGLIHFFRFKDSASAVKKLILILISLQFIQCEKSQNRTNVILYNKSLIDIQHNIYGKWKMVYAKGGICATCIQNIDSSIWWFTNDNKIVKHLNGIDILDTALIWNKELGTYTNGDSTYVMSFYDKYGYPNNFVVDRIRNDTLILHDFSSDAVFYYFTKP